MSLLKELNVQLKDFEGKTFEIDGKPITLKRAILRACDYGFAPGGNDLDPEIKYRRHNIGLDISRSGDEIELGKNDYDELYEMIKFFLPGIYSRCRALLDKYKAIDKKE